MPSLFVVVVIETLVSMLVILHSAPTIIASLGSVTRPEIQAPLGLSEGHYRREQKITTSIEHFIEYSPTVLARRDWVRLVLRR